MKITIDWQRNEEEIKQLLEDEALPCSMDMAIEAVTRPAVIEIDNRVLKSIYNEDPCAYTMLLSEEVGEMLQTFSKLQRRSISYERLLNMVEEVVDTLITIMPAFAALNISGIHTTSLIQDKLNRLESRFITGNVIFKDGPKRIRTAFLDKKHELESAMASGEITEADLNALADKIGQDTVNLYAIINDTDGRSMKELAKAFNKPTEQDERLKQNLVKSFKLPRVFNELGITPNDADLNNIDRPADDEGIFKPEVNPAAEPDADEDDILLTALDERGIAIVDSPEDHSYTILGETQKTPEYFHVLYEYLKSADHQVVSEMVRTMYAEMFPAKGTVAKPTATPEPKASKKSKADLLAFNKILKKKKAAKFRKG